VLLRTKLLAPQPHSGAVRRASPLERLDHSAQSPLTLISAPTGFGKTSLLSTWVHEGRTPVAWYPLDPDDDEPTRSWASELDDGAIAREQQRSRAGQLEQEQSFTAEDCASQDGADASTGLGLNLHRESIHSLAVCSSPRRAVPTGRQPETRRFGLGEWSRQSYAGA
jgi:hypothetical protein